MQCVNYSYKPRGEVWISSDGDDRMPGGEGIKTQKNPLTKN